MEKWQYNIELPAPRTREKEFPFGEKGVIVCSVCHSVYYKKSWHHNKNQKSLPAGQAGKIKNQKFVLCPACQMIKDKEFEGQLTISNFPLNLKTDLFRFIKNFCQRAFERDPMDRLIAITQINADDTQTNAEKFQRESALSPRRSAVLIITTTENQLAVKLAKKIKEVFNKYKAQIKISYSPEPSDTTYIKINFAE